MIDGRLGPSRVLDGWQGRTPNRKESPVFPVLFRNGELPAGRIGRKGGRGLGPGRAHLNPLNQVGDLLLAEVLSQRHAQAGVSVIHGLYQEALRRLAWDDGGPQRSPLDQSLTGVHLKPAAGRFAVAAIALRYQKGAYPVLKEFLRVRWGIVTPGGGRAQSKDAEYQDEGTHQLATWPFGLRVPISASRPQRRGVQSGSEGLQQSKAMDPDHEAAVHPVGKIGAAKHL